MSQAFGFDMHLEQGPSDEGQVPDQVQHLMADELVREAQALGAGVELVLADDDGVVQRTALGQALRAQESHLVLEAEGARRRDLGEISRRV